MQEVSPQSPEERRKRPGEGQTRLSRRMAFMQPGSYAREVLKRVFVGVYSDGFVHAGNLAYLSLLTLFPFFIVAAAVARLFGQTGEGLHAVEAFLRTVPPSVAQVLQTPITDVLTARSGSLLWFGAIVGLWTTASFIETIRDILRRAYGVKSIRPFWQYRLWSIGLILTAMILILVAFAFQIMLLAVEQFILRVLPFAANAATIVSFSRLAPALALFAALYMVFYALTPRKYRESKCPKWPGALFTAGWWLLVTALLPVILGLLGSYDLTYGSLAGVMIALIFFFFVGLGLVVGAELNAALAESDDEGVEDLGGSNKQEAAAA
ncbi:MAG: YihY/virulence factor BrkB family protein [Sphingomonas sp.]|jgi:membrane protein|uniref:YihY/virulence factor BrkB family protein n=1 Tax=Sphingomonas sp. TaxID=28214 RepID=UPI00356A00C8